MHCVHSGELLVVMSTQVNTSRRITFRCIWLPCAHCESVLSTCTAVRRCTLVGRHSQAQEVVQIRLLCVVENIPKVSGGCLVYIENLSFAHACGCPVHMQSGEKVHSRGKAFSGPRSGAD